jgi:hypothetical protein
VKVGAVMAGYKGRVELTEIDAVGYVVRMKAEGNESGGGTARGLMMSKLVTLADGGTEVIAEASVDLTGKLMQVGRGMIQGVSKQLFQQFVTRARAQIEAIAIAEAGEASSEAQAMREVAGKAPAAARASAAPPIAAREEAIAVLPLLLRTFWAGIVDFVRRLFGRTN